MYACSPHLAKEFTRAVARSRSGQHFDVPVRPTKPNGASSLLWIQLADLPWFRACTCRTRRTPTSICRFLRRHLTRPVSVLGRILARRPRSRPCYCPPPWQDVALTAFHKSQPAPSPARLPPERELVTRIRLPRALQLTRHSTSSSSFGAPQCLDTLPNVRANRAPAAGRQARAGENVPRTVRPGLVARRWCSG